MTTASAHSGLRGKLAGIGVARTLGGIWFAIVLFVVVLVAPFISYACKKDAVYMDPMYLVIAVLACLGVICVLMASSRCGLWTRLESKRTFRLALLVACAILFVLQLVVVYGACFRTGWDVSWLTSDNPRAYDEYYAYYPNQLLLAGIFARAIRLFGITGGYLALVVLGCLLVTLSIGLVAAVARQLGGSRLAVVFFLVGAVFIGLSPWILVPYSDTYAMAFTSLSLWIYVCCKARYVKWPAFFAVVYIGYCIKPTVIFVGVAVVLVEVVRLAKRMRGQTPEERKALAGRCAANLAIAIAAVAVAMLAVSMLKLHVDHVDDSKQISPTHFLMMGFNPETGGVYSQDDVEFSFSFDDPAERQAANLRVFFQRVSDAGPAGTFGLLIDKMCTNFADGTFAWEQEGGFYLNIRGQSTVMQQVYGFDSVIASNPFESLDQIIWLGVLAGCLIACFCARKGQHAVRSIALALLFLGLFVLFFEARARYLLLFAPYFVLLATVGWARVGAWARRRFGCMIDAA